jgi:hypothetical protein
MEWISKVATGPVRTSPKLWLAASGCLFFAIWIFPLNVHPGSLPLRAIWRAFINQEFYCPFTDMLSVILVITLVVTIMAACLGWLIQLPICVLLRRRQRRQ